MPENEWLAERFETHRRHLRVVAFRMLGSGTEADDAVQEAWLRLSRADTSAVENLGGWLTTVVARVCLDMLRSRRSRREESLGTQPTEPAATPGGAFDPEKEALLADSVGPALLVVLETLAPAERVAFVLHDLFAVPFDEIATILGRSPTAARQLASRARRRVQGTASAPDADLTGTREVVDAFLSAARNGDFEALVALLAPDVVVRADAAAVRLGATSEVRGAEAVANSFKGRSGGARRALVDGVIGAMWAPGGKPRVVFDFTIEGGKIVAVDLVADPARLDQLELVPIDD